MGYYIGDIPSEAIILDPPETVDLADFTDSTAVVVAPNTIDTAVPSTIDAVAGVIIIDPPNDESLFGIEGIHRLRVTLSSFTTGYRQRLPDVRIVVQDSSSQWHTLDSIREEWPDAEYIDDAPLWSLLSLAREDVLEFAPALADDAPVPDRYREGQRVHARNVWNASKVSTDGSIGQDDFVIRPHPLDWHVKQIIRPKRARGAVA